MDSGTSLASLPPLNAHNPRLARHERTDVVSASLSRAANDEMPCLYTTAVSAKRKSRDATDDAYTSGNVWSACLRSPEHLVSNSKRRNGNASRRGRIAVYRTGHQQLLDAAANLHPA